MASKQTTVDFILAQVATMNSISARKMFGEFGLYCGGRFFGVVCDDQLFIKPTPGGRTFLGDEVQERSPYPGAKPHLLVPARICEDGARLTALLTATAAELPTPVKRGPPSKMRRASG